MKIRQGFVSNSSSSSFVLYGCSFESFEDILKALKEELDEETKAELEESDFYEISDELQKIINIKGLKLEVETYSDYGIYIGREPTTIGDNETGKQFKDGVVEDLSKIFNIDNKDINYMSECFYS